MSGIVIVLLEDSDPDAERIFAALSEGGLECQVRRARTCAALPAVLAGGPVDVILAAGSPHVGDVIAILDVARARCPGVPVVVVQRDPRAEQAVELLARGAAGYVPGYRLEQLGPVIHRALENAARGEGEGSSVVERAVLPREATAAGRREDDLLSRAAHELRTPLNAMLGWASMLRTRRLDEAARERALETIERNARVQARLIDDLLDVSQMLTQKLRIEVSEVEICPAVAAVIEAARPAAQAKTIALSAALDDAAGAVAGDPRRLRQVLHELLANALRATPQGGRVGVRLARAGSRVEIAVSDTGRGIHADLLPHLFEGFPRAGARPGGLGVGLSLVRHLVEAHGGAVLAESAGEGHGATFTVRLPRLRDAA